MRIKKATPEDARKAAELASMLWDEHTVEDLTEEMSQNICGEKSAIFLAFEGDCQIGFAQCQLRADYVEGTKSSPVGYLEGIFVREEYRHHGVAKAILVQSERWAKEQGCEEFASDCEIDNSSSLKFHLNTGFEEVNRIVCFAKKLDN